MHIINLIISASTIYVEWDNGFDGIKLVVIGIDNILFGGTLYDEFEGIFDNIFVGVDLLLDVFSFIFENFSILGSFTPLISNCQNSSL